MDRAHPRSLPMTSLSDGIVRALTERLQKAQDAFAARYPGEPASRQPVHTVYGGAHLFKSDTVKKLGELALRSLSEHAPEPKIFADAIGIRADLAAKVYARVQEKLRREAVEDFRIDFEDGYGNRPDAEEDAHAQQAAEETAKGLEQRTLPPFIGIRIKTFSAEMGPRSLRTPHLDPSRPPTCTSPRSWDAAGAACPPPSSSPSRRSSAPHRSPSSSMRSTRWKRS